MRRSLFILAGLLVAAGCGPRKTSGPEEAAVTFVAAVINDWGDHKITLVDTRTKTQLERLGKEARARGFNLKPSDFLVSIPQARDDWLSKKTPKTITNTGETAVVEIVSTAPNAPRISLDLIREGGRWKVSLLE